MQFLKPRLSAWALATILCGGAIADIVDPNDDNSQFAYAGNIGWVNAEPNGDGGDGITVEEGKLAGWLWSANTGWISLNCKNTDSCDTVNYSVSLDGAGLLSGFAWSPNLGWISFSCTNTTSCGAVDYRVEVDQSNGNMSGFAYAANAGWIGFSCDNTDSCEAVEYRVRLSLDPPPEDVFQDGFEPIQPL